MSFLDKARPVSSTSFSSKARPVSNPIDTLNGFKEIDKPGYFQRVGTAFNKAAQDIVGGISRPAELAEQGASPLRVGGEIARAGLRTVGGVAGAAFAPITEAIAPVLSPIVEKIAQIPGVAGGIEAVSKWAQANPDAAKDLQNVFDVSALGAGSFGEKAGKEVGEAALKNIGKQFAELTAKSEQQIDSAIIKGFEKGVKPAISGKGTAKQLSAYKDDVVTAVKTINSNRPNLTFIDDVGETIIGEAPKSLQQLSEALDQTKKTIFSQYDNLAKQAGKEGGKVDLNPIASELNTVIENKALRLTNPKAAQYARDVKERLLAEKDLDVTTAQDVVQNYNKSLEAFYRNPTYDNASQAAIDALVANKLRESLDNLITGLTGEEYGALKSQYGSLKTIEKDVVRASLRDAKKNVKGLIDYADIFSGGQVLTGILTMNPAQVSTGLTQKAITEYFKFLNNPNRAIEKMFKAVGQLP